MGYSIRRVVGFPGVHGVLGIFVVPQVETPGLRDRRVRAWLVRERQLVGGRYSKGMQPYSWKDTFKNVDGASDRECALAAYGLPYLVGRQCSSEGLPACLVLDQDLRGVPARLLKASA